MKVIILTASAKDSRNCVAGIDIATGQFVRLVQSNGKALTDADLRCRKSEHKCQPLDLVEISIVESSAQGHQSENRMIDGNKGFTYLRKVNLTQVLQCHPIDKPAHVLGDDSWKVDVNKIAYFNHSLELLYVKNLVVEKLEKKSKARFVYNGKNYKYISVTDKNYFEEKKKQIGDAVIVMSLAQDSVPDGYGKLAYYKFIAHIFPV